MTEEHSCCHEHHHDHECCEHHGHEHNHDHEDAYCHHDHDHEGACCGHDHDHEHEHEHEHERICHALPHAVMEFEAYSHDEANVVSGSIKPASGASIPFSQVVDFLQAAVAEVKAKRGIIGHFKANAVDGEKFAHVSITQSSVQPTLGGQLQVVTSPEGVVEFALIAVVIPLDKLAALVQDLADRTFV